jgi:hypothetical protein
MTNMMTKLATIEVNRLNAPPAHHAKKHRLSLHGPMNRTLLTSFFFNEHHGHWVELAGALHVNLHNPYFSSVHVLLESPTGSECHELRARITRSLNGTEWSPDAAQRLVCVPVRSQPNYADFFNYANKMLDGSLVVMANTDVAFDDTLGLIDSRAFSSGKIGYVISVQPPQYGGEYSKAFGTECNSESRCTLGSFDAMSGKTGGWLNSGDSWDVYVFRPPLQGMHEDKLDHVMNTMGGENRAAYQLEVESGLHLWNPCMHIHAFHWHCMGGDMHRNTDKTRVDKDEKVNAVDTIMPCWDCPGMRLPSGKVPSQQMCEHGRRHYLTDVAATTETNMLPMNPFWKDRLENKFERSVVELFRRPQCVSLCVSSASEEPSTTPSVMCQDSGDMDCFISQCGSVPHRYY